MGAVVVVISVAEIVSALGSGFWLLVLGVCVVAVMLSLRRCRVKYCASSVGVSIEVVGAGWLVSGLSWK